MWRWICPAAWDASNYQSISRWPVGVSLASAEAPVRRRRGWSHRIRAHYCSYAVVVRNFGDDPAWLDTRVCVTCFAILWLALKGKGVSSSVATTLDAAAGLAQRQKWGLILPSSARVSKLTYQTVIGVRYPELVKPTPDGWRYGRYVSTEATLQGGFLPIFWDVPKSTMHAVSDIGALVEWLQEHIAFGQDSTENLAVPQTITKTLTLPSWAPLVTKKGSFNHYILTRVQIYTY